MANSIAKRLGSVHPQMLRARGEGHPQELGNREKDAEKRAIGRAIEVALDRSRITKQAAATDMGYSDSGVMGRWINGTETPQFAKLWTLGLRFQQELVIALAEEAGMRVTTTIERVAA